MRVIVVVCPLINEKATAGQSHNVLGAQNANRPAVCPAFLRLGYRKVVSTEAIHEFTNATSESVNARSSLVHTKISAIVLAGWAKDLLVCVNASLTKPDR